MVERIIGVSSTAPIPPERDATFFKLNKSSLGMDASAAQIITAARAVLAVWIAAVQDGCTLDSDGAGDLTNVANTIDRMLGSIEEADWNRAPDDWFAGCCLVRTIENALWNVGAGESSTIPSIDQLVTAAKLADAHLGCVVDMLISPKGVGQ